MKSSKDIEAGRKSILGWRAPRGAIPLSTILTGVSSHAMTKNSFDRGYGYVGLKALKPIKVPSSA